MILGDSYITINRKISIFRGHFVSLKSKFRGHLRQKRAKSRLFEGQRKLCVQRFFIAKYSDFIGIQLNRGIT